MAISKVVYGGTTLIDLTADTVKKEHLLEGYIAHGADGEKIIGECTYDSNTQDATASEAEILKDKTAYVRGTKRTGTMKNNGAVSGVISEKDEEYNVPQGYHDGSGKVCISETEKNKLIPTNIRNGIEILGVTGSMTGEEDVTAHAKEFTPTADGGTVLPDAGIDYLTQVIVKPIPYVESDNAAGGKTVTIA